MKKIIIFLILQINAFSIGFLNKQFNANIVETSKNSKKEYLLVYKPDEIKLVMNYPTVNKGEIYTYKNNKKYIYYPLLEQTVEQEFVNEDIDFFNILNKIKDIKKTQIINGKKYIVKNDKLEKIESSDYTVKFTYNKNNMPSKVVFDSKNYDKVEFEWKY